MNENLKEIFGKKIQSTLEGLGNNKVQDILDEMGMIDENGYCPYTAEEIFTAGIEWVFGEIFGWTLDDVDFNKEYEFKGITESRESKGTLKKLINEIEKPNFKEDEVKDDWEHIQDFIEKLGHFPKDSDELNVLINYVLNKKIESYLE